MAFLGKKFNTQLPQGKPRKSIALSQNFINNKGIIATIMGFVDFTKANLILEIGPGKGIITDALIKPQNKVIAVEMDNVLYSEAKRKYHGVENVTIVHEDFLKYPLPKEKFIVVANIPFNITAEVIKKITDKTSLLQAAYLITEKEAAYKFVGPPNAESPLLSHFLHIHYEVKFLKQISSSNFTPVPKTDIGFISIVRRKTPVFEKADEDRFKDLVTYFFTRTGPTLKEGLKRVFSNLQAKIILENLNLSEGVLKKKVVFSDWVKVYKTFIEHSPEKSRQVIRGAYIKLSEDQSKIQPYRKMQKAFKRTNI
ncbi:MAG: 23S ribosomal RNA methyltransferase Erm [Bacteroidetes bacterium]|nr:23S ribosomal RNA methyltransferase Erm [Bacteroidota bacterium]